jgi:hypothetical protein
MPVAIAIAGAAVVGAGVSITASNKAAKTAKQNAATNNALQQNVYDENKALLAPYVGAGNAATPTIQGLLGLGDSAAAGKAFDTYKSSTGYQSRLAEGNAGVNAALGASSLRDSGAAVKAAAKFNQTFASNEFGSYLGALQGQQQVGLAASGQQAALGQNYANSVSANNNNAANVQANAFLANGAAINSALGSAVSAYGYSQGALSSSYKGSSGGRSGLLSGFY